MQSIKSDLLRVLTLCLCFPRIFATAEVSEALQGTDWNAYERGKLGSQPQTKYRTSKATSPLVHVTKQSEGCDQDGHILLAPRGDEFARNKALLLDGQGSLVWYHEERGAVNDLRIQSYMGEDYLTYWVGDDNFYGHGAGYFKMVCLIRSTSGQQRKIKADTRDSSTLTMTLPMHLLLQGTLMEIIMTFRSPTTILPSSPLT